VEDGILDSNRIQSVRDNWFRSAVHGSDGPRDYGVFGRPTAASHAVGPRTGSYGRRVTRIQWIEDKQREEVVGAVVR
jgi:hypothetical protein